MKKEEIRKQVWDLLERENIARFPRPVYGRIPNFQGSEKAAEILALLPEFTKARTVKVNPDAPQRKVRELTLLQGKQLLMPAPRLRSGFILVKPDKAKKRERIAASIKGAMSLGDLVGLEDLPKPDLLVAGSVAVSKNGSRIGKGEGYSEIEYAILRELGLVKENIPICTTVHPVQIVPSVPQDPYDVAVDYVITPSQAINTNRRRKRPEGILWDHVTSEMLAEMPILEELKRRSRG